MATRPSASRSRRRRGSSVSGRRLVFYARRGNQIDLFDRPGAHPQTRQRLEPITEDVANEALARLPNAPGASGSVVVVRIPKRVTIQQDMELFDASGEALYWFDPNYENWELYDTPGAHPRSGAPMVPLDRSYAAILREAIRVEKLKQPADLRGRGLQELKNYSRELTARTRSGS